MLSTKPEAGSLAAVLLSKVLNSETVASLLTAGAKRVVSLTAVLKAGALPRCCYPQCQSSSSTLMLLAAVLKIGVPVGVLLSAVLIRL